LSAFFQPSTAAYADSFISFLIDLAGLDYVGERDGRVLPQLGLQARVLLAFRAAPQELGVVVLRLGVVLGVGNTSR